MSSAALDLFAGQDLTSGEVAPGQGWDVAFTVYGTPAPAGSKKAVPLKSGRWAVVDDSKRSRPWKEQVAQRAGEIMTGRELFRGPIEIVFRFFVRRPKSHFGARGLRPSAPRHPTIRPDVLKLARGVEDALSGIVYADDSQIVREQLVKEYGAPERVEVFVRALP
ncbi:MAG TPA: RusA family crossover junction endodeoxyribonuclease [Longimicrobiales bacterium]|nr:RusA family crossover junction endodeoxyribonuclease [Longimicrobiales bacterium]